MSSLKFLCVWLLTLAGAGCSFCMLPPYRVHDGYDGMSKSGAVLGAVLESEDIVELKKLQISGMIERSPYTWLLIAAPWCPYAMKDWEKISMEDAALSRLGVNTMIVFADYRLRFISSQKRKYDYRKGVFVLDNIDFGDSTWKKTEKLLQELDVQSIASEKYPIHLLFDSEQNLIFSAVGTVKDPMEVVRNLESDGDLRIGSLRY
ncbi:MAG: hypothetical protein ACKOA1_08460 [Bacteroidota bacterium]